MPRSLSNAGHYLVICPFFPVNKLRQRKRIYFNKLFSANSACHQIVNPSAPKGAVITCNCGQRQSCIDPLQRVKCSNCGNVNPSPAVQQVEIFLFSFSLANVVVTQSCLQARSLDGDIVECNCGQKSKPPSSSTAWKCCVCDNVVASLDELRNHFKSKLSLSSPAQAAPAASAVPLGPDGLPLRYANQIAYEPNVPAAKVVV